MASSPDDFDSLFSGMQGSIDSYIMLPDSKLYNSKVVKSLLSQSLSSKIPVVGLSSIYTRAGAYISFDYDYRDLGKQAGSLASGIASGKKQVGKLVYPRKITTSINETVARQLGIDLSGGLLDKADRIFRR